MNGFLVDTNVISEILRAAPDPNVASWSQQVTKQRLFLSVVPIGELRKGLTIMPVSSRRSRLERLIEEQLVAWFGGRILPVTQSIAERWGTLEGSGNSKAARSACRMAKSPPPLSNTSWR